MDQIVSRLEHLYTRMVNSHQPNDVTVRMIPPILRKAREVRAVFGGGVGGGGKVDGRTGAGRH